MGFDDAVSGAARVPSAPELPTIAETLPGFVTGSYQGLLAAAGTPRDIVQRIATEVAKVVRAPDVRERLAALGAEPVGSTPAEFAAHIRNEIDKWARVVKQSGARVD